MRVLALFAMGGCATSGDGSSDTAADPAASAGGGLVWVDADGAVVEGVVALPEGLSFVDLDGNFWSLDPVASSDTAFGPMTTISDRLYADPACTDRLLWRPPPPRYVIDLGESGDNHFVVAPDDLAPSVLDTSYYNNGGSCEENQLTEPVLRVADLYDIALPVADWAPPLHPELR